MESDKYYRKQENLKLKERKAMESNIGTNTRTVNSGESAKSVVRIVFQAFSLTREASNLGGGSFEKTRTEGVKGKDQYHEVLPSQHSLLIA